MRPSIAIELDWSTAANSSRSILRTALKQSARTSELPNPTMEEAFIELINRFDEREKR